MKRAGRCRARLAEVALLWSLASVAAASSLPHLALDLQLDPASRRLDAQAQFESRGTTRFSLHRSLTVIQASVDGKPAEVHSEPEAADMRTWQIDASRGGMMRIEYGGTLPPLEHALDHRRVLTTRVPMASTQGSFFPAGGGWHPRPYARFSYRVKLNLPGGQRGVVPGELRAESSRDAGYECVIEFLHPAAGIDLMAGPYTVRERLVARRGAPPVRLRTYFYPDLDHLAEAYLGDSERYLRYYSEAIGDYPFGGFSIVASPLPTGFGMPSLTYIGREVLKLPFIRATSLRHEILHNWWGNGVDVDYEQGNWSEGLTTFMADYLRREEESAVAAREMRLAWLRDFAAIPSGADRPLAAFRARTHGAEAAIGYGKAAMVFFMLRDTIGIEAFRDGIRRFWLEQRFKQASWSDLQRAFEQSSGRSLAMFFEQWLRRSGAPALEITSARAAQAGAVVLDIKQSPPPYVLDVPVELHAANRTETERVHLDRERLSVKLAPGTTMEGVRLDPDFRLWRRLEPEALPPILRQWIIARAPRLWVVSEAHEATHAAAALAQRLFERPALTVKSIDASAPGDPVLIVGLADDVARTLARAGLPPRPNALGESGSAHVWTIEPRTPGAAPIAVVSATDAAALAAIARPLPHYGAQSYVVFDQARVMERGIWPAQPPVVPVSVR